MIRRIRRAQYSAMPWRNGMGMTLEIAREPPGPAAPIWRLGLSTISQSGPLPDLSGYQRCATLIDGGAYRLDVLGGKSQELRAVGDTARLPAGSTIACLLLDGPSRHISLTVREPGTITSVETLRCERERYLPSDPGAMQALFCIEGDAILAQHHELVEFAKHDSVVSPCNEVSSLRPARSTPALLLRLVWRIAPA